MTEKRLLTRSMAEVKMRPIDWLWPGWLARRKVHILGGDAGKGKSYLTAALAAGISTGSPWPDGTPCERGRVLLLLAEDDLDDTVKPRLFAHGADMQRIAAIEAVVTDGQRPQLLDLRRDLDVLEDALDGVDLLVIDPISAFMRGGDRHTEEVRDILTPVKDVAQRTNTAVLGVAHLNKGGGGRNVLHQILGAVAFGAVPRIVWALAPASNEPDETRRVVQVVKTNLSTYPPPLEWRIVSGDEPIHWYGQSELNVEALLRPASPASDTLTPDQQAIANYLAAHGPSKPSDVAAALGKNVSTTQTIMGRMVDHKKLVRQAYCIYAVAGSETVKTVESVDSVKSVKTVATVESSSGDFTTTTTRDATLATDATLLTGASPATGQRSSAVNGHSRCRVCGSQLSVLNETGLCGRCAGQRRAAAERYTP